MQIICWGFKVKSLPVIERLSKKHRCGHVPALAGLGQIPLCGLLSIFTKYSLVVVTNIKFFVSVTYP